MIDLKQIGYFLYMEEQEKKLKEEREQQEQMKFNVKKVLDLEREEATTNKNRKEEKRFFLKYTAPYEVKRSR